MTTETDYLEWLRDHFESSTYWKNLGFTFHSLEKGAVSVKAVVSDGILNVNKTLHGGAILSLVDVAISATLRSMQPNMVTTVSLTTNFMNPAKEGKTVYATADIVNSKSRIQYVNAKVEDEDGVVIADAIGVFSILKEKDIN
ncbi:PaaI family thioesterase [Planococcus salinus]|nr:PaaI family thioesterase [Planococcus salinus]